MKYKDLQEKVHGFLVAKMLVSQVPPLDVAVSISRIPKYDSLNLQWTKCKSIKRWKVGMRRLL